MMESMNIATTGLVLEGGGMRGVFTAGVLDYFMDQGIWFPFTVGVSAGASNGISYASRQRGRSRYCDLELPKIRPYVGLKYLLRGKGIIDLEFLFHEFPEKYYPFDYDAYKANPNRFIMVASSCLTGQAEYIEEKTDMRRLVNVCEASCSMPVLCPVKWVNGVPMVDGGVCDPIPVKFALRQGFRKNVIVLTRNKGYRKPDKDFRLPGFIYRKYPAIRERLKDRYRQYNEVLDFIDKLEADGNAIVIRPQRPIDVSRTEKDLKKLQNLYDEGYSLAEAVKSRLSICQTGSQTF